jgi:hypothetical protein
LLQPQLNHAHHGVLGRGGVVRRGRAVAAAHATAALLTALLRGLRSLRSLLLRSHGPRRGVAAFFHEVLHELDRPARKDAVARRGQPRVNRAARQGGL